MEQSCCKVDSLPPFCKPQPRLCHSAYPIMGNTEEGGDADGYIPGFEPFVIRR